MNNKMKPEAVAPEVSEAAAAAASGDVDVTESRSTGALIAAFLCAVAPGCVHIQTGTKAGDCYHRVERELDGLRVPDVMHVGLDESNPKGPCTGEWSDSHMTRDEPCPVYDNGEIIMRNTGGLLWGGPEGDWYAPREDWPGKVDVDKPALLTGKTKKFDATGKYDSEFGHPPRDLSGRMTALITEIRTWNDRKVPVCGVLYGNDGKEGVPIFRSPSDGKEFGGEWGNSYVKFFWPDKN